MKFNYARVMGDLISGLTLLAALPAQLGDLSILIPEAWKPKIITVGLAATVLLRIIGSYKPPVAPVVVLLCAGLALGGCAGSGPNGRWTPADTSAAFGAVDQGVDTFQRVRALFPPAAPAHPAP